jgi:hypothetical protein
VVSGIFKEYATFIFKGPRSKSDEDEGAHFFKCQKQITQKGTITYQKTGILTAILKYQVRLIMESKTHALAGMRVTWCQQIKKGMELSYNRHVGWNTAQLGKWSRGFR